MVIVQVWGLGAWRLTSFVNLDIIAAHVPLPHFAVLGEGPVLQAVAPLPLHAVMRILELIPELYSNLVVGKSEEFLAQPVVFLLLPLLGQEFLYGRCAYEER